MKNTKQNDPIEKLKSKLESIHISNDINKNKKNSERIDRTELKKLAIEIRKTFTDEDLQPQLYRKSNGCSSGRTF